MGVSNYEPVFRKLATELELIGPTYSEIVELFKQIYNLEAITKAMHEETAFRKFMRREEKERS